MITLVHRFKPEVPQIRYFSWGDGHAPKEYWTKVNDIAYFIGSALNSRVEGELTSIKVYQTKEKFGAAIVYCGLVSDDLLIELWESSSEFKPGPIPEEFERKMLLRDVAHYRRTYQRAFSLWPEYHAAILDGADLQVLLCQSRVEFDELRKYHLNVYDFDLTDPDDVETISKICNF